MSAVGLRDGPVERLVVEGVDASAVVTTRVRHDVSMPDELLEKLPRLLPVDDARERSVLAENAHAGVQHYGHEEPCLPLGEPAVDDGLQAVLGSHWIRSSAWSGSNGEPP